MKEKTLAVNIPADGLFLAILEKANGDFSEENCARVIKEYIDRHIRAGVDTFMLNVCYRRCLTPSDVFDSYLYDIDENGNKTLSPVTDGVSKYFMSFFTCARVLLQNGVDIYKILTKHLKSKDCKVYFSLRMNDGHYTENPAINSGFAMRAHSITGDGKRLDFSQKAVQDYFCNYVKELLENYELDGIELDWLRFTTVLPEHLRNDYGILSAYMQRLRSLLDSFDKSLSLAVRVLSNEKDNLKNGVDVCRWVADGSADIVTIENFYIPTNFELPVKKWRESISRTNTKNRAYKLFCGTDWGVSCKKGYNIAITPAYVRGFASECISRGADGIYLFNFFEQNSESSFELCIDKNGKPQLENCFESRMLAVKDSAMPATYVHIADGDERYPIPLDKSYSFNFNPCHAFKSCKIVIGCDSDASLSVCGVRAENEITPEGYGYIPEDKINEHEFIYSVSQAAPFVKSACLDFKGGEITITNESDSAANILWLELRFE